jgi:hypothetical protein
MIFLLEGKNLYKVFLLNQLKNIGYNFILQRHGFFPAKKDG